MVGSINQTRAVSLTVILTIAEFEMVGVWILEFMFEAGAVRFVLFACAVEKLLAGAVGNVLGAGAVVKLLAGAELFTVITGADGDVFFAGAVAKLPAGAVVGVL